MLTQRLIDKYLAFEVGNGRWLQAHSLLGSAHTVWCPAVIWHSYLILFSFMLFLSVLSLSVSSAALPPSNPSAFVFALPEASLFHFASLCLHLSPCIPAPGPLLLHLSLTPTLDLFIRRCFIFCLKCVFFFLSRCSGPTDSTSLTTRARAALNFSSRPKSWKRSGWNSLAWPCKCVLSLCLCACVNSCVTVWKRRVSLWLALHFVTLPVPLFKLDCLMIYCMRNTRLWQKDEEIKSCALTLKKKSLFENVLKMTSCHLSKAHARVVLSKSPKVWIHYFIVFYKHLGLYAQNIVG